MLINHMPKHNIIRLHALDWYAYNTEWKQTRHNHVITD